VGIGLFIDGQLDSAKAALSNDLAKVIPGLDVANVFETNEVPI